MLILLILIIIELMYLIYNGYYLYNLIIDIRATELHNESEEAKRDDNKVGMGTCEISESGSGVLGRTGYVVLYVSVYTYLYLPHAIVN